MTTESQDLGLTSHPKDIYIHTYDSRSNGCQNRFSLECCLLLHSTSKRQRKPNILRIILKKNTIKIKKEWHIKQVIAVFIYFSCVVNKIVLINKKKLYIFTSNKFNFLFYFGF